MKDPNKVKMGKKSRAKGKVFESRVREELTKQGWIVVRWDNQVELEHTIPCPDGKEECLVLHRAPTKLVQAKNKYNPFTKTYMATGGFPDFLAFKKDDDSKVVYTVDSDNPKVLGMLGEQVRGFGKAENKPILIAPGIKVSKIGTTGFMLVEAKTNNTLDKKEKLKCQWIEENLKINCYVAYLDYPSENIELPPNKRKKKQVILRRWNQ